MSPSSTWSNRLQMDLWIPLYVFLTIVPVISQSAHYTSCPRDLETPVNSCFTQYSVRLQILNNSPRKLCCGVDVETIRAVCQSYTSALRCIHSLKRVCPSKLHHTIDSMLVNIDGEAKAGLMDLCQDDHVIEAYAMYQACIDDVGPQSEQCFTSHLKDSSGIRFLSKVNMEHKDTFCRNMRDTVKCVQRNVELSCQDKAAVDLAVLLVKPMVRDSSQCDYSIVDNGDMKSKTTDREKPTYISDDSRFNRDSKSGNPDSKNSNSNTQRRHKHRNSNSGGQPSSSRGRTNAGSHSGNNPGGGAAGIHLTGCHCNHVISLFVFGLFTIVFRRFLTWSN